MKPHKNSEEEDFVELIASGYAWYCPACDTFNPEIEVSETVKCDQCGKEFSVADHYHAYQ